MQCRWSLQSARRLTSPSVKTGCPPPQCMKRCPVSSCSVENLARPKRFELLTPRFVVWCSIQLSYGRATSHALHGLAIRSLTTGRDVRCSLATAFPKSKPIRQKFCCSCPGVDQGECIRRGEDRACEDQAGRRRPLRAWSSRTGWSGMVTANVVRPPLLSTSSTVPPWARISS